LVLARARLAKLVEPLVEPMEGVGVLRDGLVGVASLCEGNVGALFGAVDAVTVGDVVCVEVCMEADMPGGADAHPTTTRQSKASKKKMKQIRRMAGILDAEKGRSSIASL
jgi:hypothetical protein